MSLFYTLDKKKFLKCILLWKKQTQTSRNVHILSRVIMEHIKRRHILPYAPPSSTTFLSQDVSVVDKLIEETRNYPDVVQPHSNDSRKIVLKKSSHMTSGDMASMASIVGFCWWC